MQTINISKGESVIVDDKDLEELTQHKWHLTTAGYAARTEQVNGKKKMMLMHRQLLGLKCRKSVVDHINGNQLDNRRCNLRVCNHSENGANRKLNANNKSGYKGVFPKGRKWIASIKAAGAQVYLGTFATKEEAALAYNEAAMKAFGEFANINNVPSNLT